MTKTKKAELISLLQVFVPIGAMILFVTLVILGHFDGLKTTATEYFDDKATIEKQPSVGLTSVKEGITSLLSAEENVVDLYFALNYNSNHFGTDYYNAIAVTVLFENGNVEKYTVNIDAANTSTLQLFYYLYSGGDEYPQLENLLQTVQYRLEDDNSIILYR